jgi:small redox-active disulfide protein 2
MRIEILGSGCARCHETERRVRAALARAGKTADVVHLYDVKEIARRGVLFTPAVVIDGQVRVSGKVPSVEEVTALLA